MTGETGPHSGVDLPGAREAWVGAMQTLFLSVTREKLKSVAPRILIRPDVGGFGTMDFLKIDEIFAAAEPVKDEVKRKLDVAIAAHRAGSAVR